MMFTSDNRSSRKQRNRHMSTDLTVVGAPTSLPAALGPDLRAAVDLAKAEKAASTRKAYGIDFRLFKEWCEVKGVCALPASPEAVAAFLAAESGHGTKPSTLARRVAAIRYAHKLAQLDTPTDSEAVKASCGASGAPWAQPKYERLQR